MKYNLRFKIIYKEFQKGVDPSPGVTLGILGGDAPM